MPSNGVAQLRSLREEGQLIAAKCFDLSTKFGTLSPSDQAYLPVKEELKEACQSAVSNFHQLAAAAPDLASRTTCNLAAEVVLGKLASLS